MRCGDHVKHLSSGETWVVAYVDGDYLGWCGWPPGEAKITDFELKKACTDAEHIDYLYQCAKSDGKRAALAKRALEAIHSKTSDVEKMLFDLVKDYFYGEVSEECVKNDVEEMLVRIKVAGFKIVPVGADR